MRTGAPTYSSNVHRRPARNVEKSGEGQCDHKAQPAGAEHAQPAREEEPRHYEQISNHSTKHEVQEQGGGGGHVYRELKTLKVKGVGFVVFFTPSPPAGPGSG